MQFLLRFFSPLRVFIQKTKTPNFHIKHLILMANVDGEYHYKEAEYLKIFAQQSGVSVNKLREIKNNLDQINFILPENAFYRDDDSGWSCETRGAAFLQAACRNS